MTSAELQELAERQTVTDMETALDALGIGRTLGYQRVRETGLICEGVRPIRVGRLWRVPVRQLLTVLGYQDPPHTCACKSGDHE